MKILDLKQNTPEWEAFRMNHIGASDIGIIMEGSDREIYDLLQLKRGLKEKYTTGAMQRGTDMEEEAIEFYLNRARSYGEKATALADEPNSWLMASFDFIDLGENLIVEVKCPLVVLDKPSEHSHYKRWIWQVQAQLAVSGMGLATILVYSPGKWTTEIIVREETMIQKLLEKGKWFYDALTFSTELPEPPEAAIREDDDCISWAIRYQEVDARIKEWEEEKEVLREEGIALANGAPFICSGVKVNKIPCKPTIDYIAACKANGIDASTFVKAPKSSFTWRISPA